MDWAWLDHRRQMQAAVREATRTLLEMVRRNPAISHDDLAFYYQALLDQYGSAAAESAMIALENSRRTLGQWTALTPPTYGDMPPIGQIQGTFAWAVREAMDPTDARTIARLLAGPLGRLIQQPARDTIWESTRAAGTRFARIPGPKACWFCLMLASRGGVYTSRKKALAGANRPEEAGYHDNCTCIAVESHDSTDLPDVVHQLQDEWYRVTWDDRGPKAGQANVWRAHIKETRPHGETIRPT